MEKGVPVIDVSHVVTAAHQDHRYAHVQAQAADISLSPGSFRP